MKVWATVDSDGRRDIWDRLPVLSGRGKNKCYIVTNGFNLDICDEIFDALFPTGMKPCEIRGPFEIKKLGGKRVSPVGVAIMTCMWVILAVNSLIHEGCSDGTNMWFGLALLGTYTVARDWGRNDPRYCNNTEQKEES